MQVEWHNPKEPLKGFQYLYLTDADYQTISAKSPHMLVKATPIPAPFFVNAHPHHPIGPPPPPRSYHNPSSF